MEPKFQTCTRREHYFYRIDYFQLKFLKIISEFFSAHAHFQINFSFVRGLKLIFDLKYGFKFKISHRLIGGLMIIRSIFTKIVKKHPRNCANSLKNKKISVNLSL